LELGIQSDLVGFVQSRVFLGEAQYSPLIQTKSSTQFLARIGDVDPFEGNRMEMPELMGRRGMEHKIAMPGLIPPHKPKFWKGVARNAAATARQLVFVALVSTCTKQNNRLW
jgi:hypothetical protein